MTILSKFKEWLSGHFEIAALLSVIFVVMATAAAAIYVISINYPDFIVYEDTQIKCYGDAGEKSYNSKMEYYCYNKLSDEIVCEYDWAKGSGNKPPQGCYL